MVIIQLILKDLQHSQRFRLQGQSIGDGGIEGREYLVPVLWQAAAKGQIV